MDFRKSFKQHFVHPPKLFNINDPLWFFQTKSQIIWRMDYLPRLLYTFPLVSGCRLRIWTQRATFVPWDPSEILIRVMFGRKLKNMKSQPPARISFLEIFFKFSLLVLDLEPFEFHFQLSKKSERNLFFTFHFSKKVKAIWISLFFLEKKEWNQVRGMTWHLSIFPNCIFFKSSSICFASFLEYINGSLWNK